MRQLLTGNVCLTFLLIVWGGIVRVSGAGLACPDWPLCQGQIIPPFQPLVLLEWGHRLLASTVGLVTLVVVVLVVIKRELRKKIGFYVLIALTLLLVQVILGALTVRHVLSPHFVTIHLAVGLSFFAVMLQLRLSCDVVPRSPTASQGPQPQRGTLFFSYGVMGLLFLQILLGGWMASNHAGLACPDFPTCLGDWVPPFLTGGILFHFLHRVGALLVTLAVIGLALVLRAKRCAGLLAPVRGSLVTVLVMQLLLGVGNVVLRLPMTVSVGHLALGTLLFAILIVIVHEVKVARLS